ncbi:MAG: RND transporter [Alphaproteobacteria bacterium PA4]|nr:MAG: RND transporter [Alphaproteobacteria bacterium PA4]
MQRQLPALAAALLLAGCATLGPDYAPPPPAIADGWVPPSLGSTAVAASDTPWWQAFNDPALDALITATIAGNRDLKVAGLRVLEARAQLGIAQSTRSPQAATASAATGYGASAPGGQPIGKYDFLYGTAGVSAGWEIDFWGKFRRSIEAGTAGYFAAIASQQDVALILRAEVARLYLQYRTLQERLAVVRSNIELQQRNVAITELQFREGDDAELDVQQARTQLLTTRAAVPQLEAGMTQTRNALALLMGRAPGDVPELALSPDTIPATPAALPVAIASDLLRQRPDVRTAAFRAGAQSAQIGIARADLYPSLSLGGSISLTRTTLGGLSNSVDIGIGPAIRWNILDFGRIRGNVRVQDARLEQALENYQQTVLKAANEVDSAAIVLVKAREEGAILADSVIAAKRSLTLANIRYREGLSDFQRVLDAQAALLRQQDRAISNRGDTAIALVALTKAVGGGWIAPTEADFASPDTRARMQARSNWAGQLDMPQSAGTPK